MAMNKTLGLLVVAILIMSLLVYVSERPSETDATLGERVLPGLKEQLNDLVEVNIVSSDTRTTLVRGDGDWVVRQRDGYPVNFDKLVTLLDGLAEATYEERKTSKPENFGVLELRDVSEKSSKAILVEASTANDRYELLIGTSASGRDGQFVRHPQENQSWLVDRSIAVDAEPSAWLDPTIIDIPESKVVRVQIETADSRLAAARAEDEDRLTLTNLPEGKELKYPAITADLARALTNVRLKDVVPRTGTAPEDPATARFHLAEGGEIVVEAWQSDDDYLLTFDLNNMEDPSDGRDISAWAYHVNRRTFDKFTKTMEDMIKVEQEEEDAAAAPMPGETGP